MADLKINHVTHAKSNKTLENGKAKLPTPEMLTYGEIAINYAKGAETISIKNADNEVVTFSSDDQIKAMVQSAQGIITEVVTNEDEQYLDIVKGELNEETNTITYTVSTKNIPTNVSELTNDKSYITLEEVPTTDLTGYATEAWVEGQNFLTSVPEEYITVETLEGKGYLTTIPTEYITEGELANMGYLTSIPENYITEDKLTEKGYATTDEVATLRQNVIDNELVIAAALTELRDTKVETEELEDYVTELAFTSTIGNIEDGQTIVGLIADAQSAAQAAATTIAEKQDGHVVVSVSQDDETKALTYTISENDIASASHVDGLGETVSTLSNELSTLKQQVKPYTLGQVTVTETNVKEAWGLFEGDTQVGGTIKVYKDSSLESVELIATEAVHSDGTLTTLHSLRFVYILSDGSKSTVNLDVSTFLSEAEFKDGLEVKSNGEVAVKVSESSEQYLTVSAEGLAVTGIDAAFEGVNDSMSEIQDSINDLSEDIATVSGMIENITASQVECESLEQLSSDITGTDVQTVLQQLVEKMMNEIRIVKLTQSEYDNLEVYDEKILYVIISDSTPQ
jgi:hypothetical protein